MPGIDLKLRPQSIFHSICHYGIPDLLQISASGRPAAPYKKAFGDIANRGPKAACSSVIRGSYTTPEYLRPAPQTLRHIPNGRMNVSLYGAIETFHVLKDRADTQEGRHGWWSAITAVPPTLRTRPISETAFDFLVDELARARTRQDRKSGQKKAVPRGLPDLNSKPRLFAVPSRLSPVTSRLRKPHGRAPLGCVHCDLFRTRLKRTAAWNRVNQLGTIGASRIVHQGPASADPWRMPLPARSLSRAGSYSIQYAFTACLAERC